MVRNQQRDRQGENEMHQTVQDQSHSSHVLTVPDVKEAAVSLVFMQTLRTLLHFAL